VALALGHAAVGGEALAGPHHQPVADAQLRDRDVHIDAVAPHARAVAGCSACSARKACVVWRLARASSCLPSSTSVMTTAPASK
jgi:hypothetical protein